MHFLHLFAGFTTSLDPQKNSGLKHDSCPFVQCGFVQYNQWPFQEPKLEVPTIYKAYVREYPSKIWPYTVQYLHFRILKFPLI